MQLNLNKSVRVISNTCNCHVLSYVTVTCHYLCIVTLCSTILEYSIVQCSVLWLSFLNFLHFYGITLYFCSSWSELRFLGIMWPILCDIFLLIGSTFSATVFLYRKRFEKSLLEARWWRRVQRLKIMQEINHYKRNPAQKTSYDNGSYLTL